MRKFTFRWAMVPAMVLAIQTHAAVLIYEGFDYSSGGINWSDINGGTGFDSGGWAPPVSYTATIVSGLDFSDYDDNYSNGNALLFQTGGTGNARNANRGVNVNSSGTVWGSYLFNLSSDTGSNEEFRTSFDGSARLLANVSGGTNFSGVSINNSDANEAASAFTPPVGTTYLYIGKWEDTGGTSDLDTGTMWILSAANYDAIKAGGITEAELNATNSGTATAIGSWGGITDTASFDFDFRRYQGTIDELKYGSEIGDLFTAIPEPSSLSLIGLALGTVYVVRLKKK